MGLSKLVRRLRQMLEDYFQNWAELDFLTGSLRVMSVFKPMMILLVEVGCPSDVTEHPKYT